MISREISVLDCTYSQKENQWFDICRHIFSSKPDVLGFLMWKSILTKEMHAKQNQKSLHFIWKSLRYQQNGMSTLQHTLNRFIDNGYNGLLKPQNVPYFNSPWSKAGCRVFRANYQVIFSRKLVKRHSLVSRKVFHITSQNPSIQACGVTFCFHRHCFDPNSLQFKKTKKPHKKRWSCSTIQLSQWKKEPKRAWIKCRFSRCFDKSSADTTLCATTCPLVCLWVSDTTGHPILLLNY